MPSLVFKNFYIDTEMEANNNENRQTVKLRPVQQAFIISVYDFTKIQFKVQLISLSPKLLEIKFLILEFFQGSVNVTNDMLNMLGYSCVPNKRAGHNKGVEKKSENIIWYGFW